MRRRTAVAAVLALATTLAACGGDGGGDDSSDDGIKTGGTYTTIIEQIDNKAPLNPFTAPTNSWGQYNNIGLAYAKNTLTDPNQFYPALAESWDVSDDQSEVTVHLQPDAKWSDGTDVTTKDIEFSYKLAFTQGTGAFVLTPGAAGTVADVEVIDDKTIKFTQDKEAPSNTFVKSIIGCDSAGCGIKIVPEHVWNEVLPADFDQTLETAQSEGEEAAAAQEKIGTIAEQVMAFAPKEDVSAGPFVFERATPSEILLKKNPNFYDADKIAPEKAVIKGFTGNEQVWAYLRSHEIDNAPFTAVPADQMKQFENDPAIEVSSSYSPVVAGLAFNQSKAPYDDLHVRKALAYLLDRDQMIEIGTPEGGEAPLTTSGMHSKALDEWFGGDAEGELGLEPYAHDPAKAEAELKEAGFTKDGDQWLLPNGDPWKITMQVVAGFSDWIAAGENMVAQLEEFGIAAETKTSPDFTVYQEEMAAGDYDLGFWLLGITASPYDVYQRIYGQSNGWTVLGNSLSHAAPGENGNWMGGTETYDVDGEQLNPGELTLDLRAASKEEMPEKIAQLAKITNENLPVIQMWDYVNTQFFVNERYEGFPADEDEALRLRAGTWMMQGWLSAK